jgi:hypothetical protein
VNLGNLAQRLSNLEASIEDLNRRFNTVTRDLTMVRSEFSGLRDKTEPALLRLDQTVKGLQHDFSQLGMLVDDSIAPQIDLNPTPRPAQQEEKSRVAIEYDADGQPFIAAAPGHKEAAEAAGYSVIGMFSRDDKTWLKLRLGVQPERRQ